MVEMSSDRNSDPMSPRDPDHVAAATLREWIVLLGVLLLSVVALVLASYIPTDSTWRPLVTALGTGLLVSAVFSFIQRMITGRVERRAQARYLAAFADKLSAEFRVRLAQLRADAATHEFPGTVKPDRRFNDELMRDLRGAHFYWFRGYSARFVAARLRLGAANTCQVHAILPDLRSADSLNLRLSYRSRGEQDARKVRESIVEELKLGLVGLFLARHEAASVELILTRAPGLDRVELFDSAIWVTLFSGEGERARFPRTVRYPGTSILHKMQASECAQIRESPYVVRRELNRNTTEAAFREIYQEVTGEELSDDRWEALRSGYLAFEQEFLITIGLNGERNAGVGSDSA